MEIDFDEHLDDNFVDESQDMEEKWVLNLLVESNQFYHPNYQNFRTQQLIHFQQRPNHNLFQH